MARPAHNLWTLEEFLAFDDGSDTHYELFDGQIVSMTPPARAHVILTGRLARIIGSALQPPCEVGMEAGIVPAGDADSWYQADLVVTCTPGSPDDPFIAAPLVVVEVLSPTTAANDYLRKLPDYRAIPSVRDILLVSSTEPRVEHWRRSEDGWKVRDLGVEDSVRLEDFEVVIAVRALYDGVLPLEGETEQVSP
jgi:Uma2 family endonuclease